MQLIQYKSFSWIIIAPVYIHDPVVGKHIFRSRLIFGLTTDTKVTQPRKLLGEYVINSLSDTLIKHMHLRNIPIGKMFMLPIKSIFKIYLFMNFP